MRRLLPSLLLPIIHCVFGEEVKHIQIGGVVCDSHQNVGVGIVLFKRFGGFAGYFWVGVEGCSSAGDSEEGFLLCVSALCGGGMIDGGFKDIQCDHSRHQGVRTETLYTGMVAGSSCPLLSPLGSHLVVGLSRLVGNRLRDDRCHLPERRKCRA